MENRENCTLLECFAPLGYNGTHPSVVELPDGYQSFDRLLIDPLLFYHLLIDCLSVALWH